MAMSRTQRAPFLVLALLVFVAVSQVVDLAVGAPEVGVRATVLVAATVGAVLTTAWILRRKRSAPTAVQRFQITPEVAPEDPDAA